VEEAVERQEEHLYDSDEGSDKTGDGKETQGERMKRWCKERSEPPTAKAQSTKTN
jgi:hypothetical protein